MTAASIPASLAIILAVNHLVLTPALSNTSRVGNVLTCDVWCAYNDRCHAAIDDLIYLGRTRDVSVMPARSGPSLGAYYV